MNWDWLYSFLLRFGLTKNAMTTIQNGHVNFGWSEPLKSFSWVEQDGSVVWRLSRDQGFKRENFPKLGGEPFILTSIDDNEERYTCLPNWNIFETGRDLAAFFLSGYVEAFAFGDQVCRLPQAFYTIAMTQITNPTETEFSHQIDLLKNAASQEGTHAIVENSLGKLLAQQGDLTTAAKLFGQAAEAIPEFAEPYSNLGALLWQNGQQDKALELFGEALLRDPMDVSVQDNFIQAGINLGAVTTLAQRLEQVGQLYPNYYGLDGLRANIAWQLNNTEHAKKLLGRALSINPNDSQALTLQREIALAELSGGGI